MRWRLVRRSKKLNNPPLLDISYHQNYYLVTCEIEIDRDRGKKTEKRDRKSKFGRNRYIHI